MSRPPGWESARGEEGDDAEVRAHFSPGQVIHHKLFDYRGVIVDVDATCQASDEWYEQVARTRPPRDQPWYHVLVHGATHMTYVAQRNLEPDESGQPITHPLLDRFFSVFREGRYESGDPIN
jgi:heat shock protein HspQ